MGEVTFSAGALAIIGTLGGLLVGTIGLLFRQLIASKDQALKDVIATKDMAIADMQSQRNSYQKMAAQSIGALELAANRARKARGEGPIEFVLPVVPEHNSPTTPAQLDAAEFHTMLAKATALALDLDVHLVDPRAPVGGIVTLHAGESVTITTPPEGR